MADMMAFHGWAYPVLRTASSSDTTASPSDTAKKRLSRSTDGRSASPSKTVFRARSSNALSDMASVSRAFRPSPSLFEESSLNTLKDPRTVSTSNLSRISSTSSHHPELNNEVAMLSDKLIQAINNQSILDDMLASARQELDASRLKIETLEQAAKNHAEELSRGRLLRKGDVEVEKALLREVLEDERARRINAEKEKKTIEQELETLTAALFEEANKMVAAAKKDREAVELKNEQLRAQIKDTELLLASHQEQLTELKSAMEDMDREDSKARMSLLTAPTSSATTTNQQDTLNQLMETMKLSPATPEADDVSPTLSTSFPHLLKSACRTDIQAYKDFDALLHLPKNSKPPSRVSSGSYSRLNIMSLAGFSSSSQSNQSQSNGQSAPSSPSMLSTSPRDSISSVQLKETKFYKRVLVEDIEPTLRLDLSSSLSWLTRRSIMSSICDGGLVVEPMPTNVIKYQFPCSLCGEHRQNEENPRTHHFRTSTTDTAQRHPLCVVCLEKMRACCDFVSYLRLIVDGHVRVGDVEDEREAWEETIRLRERMFWSRVGGGVVPAFIQKLEEGATSRRPSVHLSEESDAVHDDSMESPAVDSDDSDLFVSKPKRVSVAPTIISINGKVLPDEELDEVSGGKAEQQNHDSPEKATVDTISATADDSNGGHPPR